MYSVPGITGQTGIGSSVVQIAML